MSAAVHQIAQYTPRSPQLENGFIRIATELMEALAGADLTARELKVALVIMRKTYGFNKKEDDVSASQIGSICNMARNHVTETLNRLEEKRVINKRIGTHGCVIGIQKDYSLWPIVGTKKRPITPEKHTSPKLGLVPSQDESSPDVGQVDSPTLGHTIDNLPKDNQKKTRSGKISLRTFLENCKTENRKPIPEGDAVFKYADEVGIPMDFIRFAWVEFKRKYSQPRARTYIDWNQHFQNAVRENWYRVWFIKDDAYQLTTRGLQIQKELKEQA